MTFRDVVRATHFPQTLAMVALMTVSSWLAGAELIHIALVMLATASGQVAVGWTNEIVDARTDSNSGRSDKAVTRGQLNRRLLWILSLIALSLTLPLSLFAAGWIGGTAHIAAVGSALAYNAKLSRTVWSWAPYALSFGLLPLFVLHSASTELWPTAPLVALASCVGVIAHLFNALPDVDLDRRASVGGLAVSLGTKRARVLLAFLMMAGAALVVVTILFGWSTTRF
jgi:4-hydroxybenzoate polyprenyltransferase